MLILIVQFLRLIGQVYSYLLLAYAVMSWVPSLRQSQLGEGLDFLVSPILKPLYRFNLQIGGLDFTVFAAMFGLELLERLLLSLVF